MKKVFLMSAALAAFMFVSCQKETKNPVDDGTEFTKGVAYVAINIEAQGTRAGTSSEDAGLPAESALTSLYLFTFDESGTIVANPSDAFYTSVPSPVVNTTYPVGVMSNSHYLVAIANPGTELAAKFAGLNANTTYASLNAAITASGHVAGIVGSNGYTMISSDDASATGGKVLYPYVTIGDKMSVVTGSNPADAAEAAATANPLSVKLERLASKLVVALDSGLASNVAGGTFAFTSWTVDAVNSSYYPFAEKTQMDETHSGYSGGTPVYAKAFYTKDPNYVNFNPFALPTDIVYGQVNDATFALALPMNGFAGSSNGWFPQATTPAYVIENTMNADSQLYGNATRIVIKATYFPTGYTAGQDWFSFQGTNYPTLDSLKNTYKDPNASDALKAACDLFYARIKAVPASVSTSISAMKFTELTQEMLNSINVPSSTGAEVTKDNAGGTDNSMLDVIRWYDGGVCY
jgi:hypothetical protein